MTLGPAMTSVSEDSTSTLPQHRPNTAPTTPQQHRATVPPYHPTHLYQPTHPHPPLPTPTPSPLLPGFADYNNDGLVDFFVTTSNTNDAVNLLYKNVKNGDGTHTFEEVAATAMVDGSLNMMGRGCGWADYDKDGFADLYVAYENEVDTLYRNKVRVLT
jgi:hypothetical protein